ncbi:hypothetical protein AQ505_14555 [Pedobacter sp. PACM 27299]|nr:hypothetical protein AQ505_14555 [Pedobacter sp. PACM 27299]
MQIYPAGKVITELVCEVAVPFVGSVVVTVGVNPDLLFLDLNKNNVLFLRSKEMISFFIMFVFL